MTTLRKNVLCLTAGVALSIAPMALGIVCYNLLQPTYISSTSVFPCTTVLVCEDGDYCQPQGTTMLDCGLCTAGPRQCCTAPGGVTVFGTCIATGPCTTPKANATGVDAGTVMHCPGGSPCTSGSPGGGGS